MPNMEINFTQIEFTKEDREKLGADLTAALLTLGLFAEELMQFQHLLLMSLHPWPDDSVFTKASSSRSHALIRILNLKVVEAKYAFKGFATSVAMQKKQKMNECETTELILNRWNEINDQLEASEFMKLAYEMRKHLTGHTPIREVKKWLPHIGTNAENRFLFHETKANSSFIACDDLVFASFLNFHFSKIDGDEDNQVRYERYLKWLIEASNTIVTEFHWASKSVFLDKLNKDVEKDMVYTLDDQFVASSRDISLPVFFPMHKRT